MSYPCLQALRGQGVLGAEVRAKHTGHGEGSSAACVHPICYIYTARSLGLVWISKEETEPTPNPHLLPPFPAPPSPM